MAAPEVRIYDIMACNVYWDFENSPLPKEQHKFLVSFYPTGDVPTPDLIDRIVARGPNGYQVEFTNQKFTNRNTDGWIYDRTTRGYWYMVNLATGFMPEGEYTIKVTSKDGSVTSRTRYQKDEPTRKLVAAYEAHKQQVMESFSPSKYHPLPDGADRTDVKVSWTTLKELADTDAYYIYRVSKGTGSKDFDTQNLTWWDNIFLQRHTEPDEFAGRNRGSIVIGNELEPNTSYAYFVEVTNANVQGETDICIFQPHQVFTTS